MHLLLRGSISCNDLRFWEHNELICLVHRFKYSTNSRVAAFHNTATCSRCWLAPWQTCTSPNPARPWLCPPSPSSVPTWHKSCPAPHQPCPCPVPLKPGLPTLNMNKDDSITYSRSKYLSAHGTRFILIFKQKRLTLFLVKTCKRYWRCMWYCLKLPFFGYYVVFNILITLTDRRRGQREWDQHSRRKREGDRAVPRTSYLTPSFIREEG